MVRPLTRLRSEDAASSNAPVSAQSINSSASSRAIRSPASACTSTRSMARASASVRTLGVFGGIAIVPIRVGLLSQRCSLSIAPVIYRNISSPAGRINWRALPRARANGTPRMTTTGICAAFFITRPAAAASSSATARIVPCSLRPLASRVPRKSSSTASPAAPIATFVRPSRHGLPNVSDTMTATRAAVSFRRRSASRCAERSGSSGRHVTLPPLRTFERSTPAFAQMNPWRVSTISARSVIRITRLDSRNTISTNRGSARIVRAQLRARAEGFTSRKRITRPSAFETTFCARTRTSPLRNSSSSRRSAAEIKSARSSPGFTSGRVRSPKSSIRLDASRRRKRALLISTDRCP